MLASAGSSLMSSPSVPLPPTSRSETSRKLWATTLRSSSTFLYFGSKSSAGTSPSSAVPGCSAIRESLSIAATKRRAETVDWLDVSTPAAPSPRSTRSSSRCVVAMTSFIFRSATGSS